MVSGETKVDILMPPLVTIVLTFLVDSSSYWKSGYDFWKVDYVGD